MKTRRARSPFRVNYLLGAIWEVRFNDRVVATTYGGFELAASLVRQSHAIVIDALFGEHP